MGAPQPLDNSKWTLCSFSLSFVLLVLAASPQSGNAVNVLTYHNDNARSGINTNESILTLSNVNSTNFGKLFDCAVDGYVYAQPLIVTNVMIPGKGVHNVVYVATEHDSVFAFDADDHSGPNAMPLWTVSFANPAAGITSVPSLDVGCTDLVPEIGITSTPVIDLATGTIYLEAKTKEVSNNVAGYFHRLHALDISTGTEKFGGPVVITASVPGSGDGNNGSGMIPFDALTQMNRPALLLLNGIIYIAYASHCDIGPYHGWLLGYDAQTLALTNVFNSTPDGGLGGVWQAGCGPSADTNGNIYFATGNGTFDPTNGDYGDCFLKFSTTNGLHVADYFAPFNQQALDDSDLDLGSGGVLLLPDSVGSIAHPHLLVGAGKEGRLYLLDRDNLGHFNPIADSQIVQSITNIGSCFDTPVCFNQTLYYCGESSRLIAFQITNATILTPPMAQSSNIFGYPGPTPAISASGTNNAIVWMIQSQGASSHQPAVLRAYNATNVALEIYDSLQADSGTRDNPGDPVKFTVPSAANGKVYVGAQQSLAVYGLGTFLATPVITPNGATFTNSILVTLTEAIPAAQIYYTMDGSIPTTNSTLYTVPFLLTNSAGLRVKAFKTGFVDSATAFTTFLSSNSIGQGVGLTAEFYSQQFLAFTNPPTLVRTDATVNVDYAGNSPGPGVSSEDFTARWSGSIQAQFSEPYTFYTITDDGVRLWIGGQLVVDAWFGQSPTEWFGTTPSLVAGRKYPITMEYFQLGGGSVARLSWSSRSTVKTNVPQTQLYPTGTPELSAFMSGNSNRQFQVQLSGLIGKSYVLQATTNFVDWMLVNTNITPPDRTLFTPAPFLNFTNLGTTNSPYLFYRAFQLP